MTEINPKRMKMEEPAPSSPKLPDAVNDLAATKIDGKLISPSIYSHLALLLNFTMHNLQVACWKEEGKFYVMLPL